ncbi:MAG: CAP domain-containing protein, partial [Cyanobacteriota bacterium]
PISNGLSQLQDGQYGADWQLLAAERIDGVNQVLWRYLPSNHLHRWLLDANWSWSASIGWDQPASITGQQLEAQFGLDLGGDGLISSAGGNVITASTTIQARVDAWGEVDRYELDLHDGAIISASLTSPSDSLYPLIDLRDPAGSLLKGSIAYNATGADLGMVDLITGKALLDIRSQVGGIGAYDLQVAVTSREELNSEVIRLTNLERQQQGLAPLVRNGLLDQAAQAHVQDMDASDRYLAHIGSNGSTPTDRIQATGYKAGWVDLGNGSLRTIPTENAASGQTSAAAVVEAWMNSPGHRAAILDPAAKEIGVGFEYDDQTGTTYWIQNFGHPWAPGMQVWF